MARPPRFELDESDGIDLSALPGTEPDGLLGTLESFIRLANSSRARRELMRACGFPTDDLPAFLALNQLALHGAMRPTQLAERMETGRPYSTKIIERLHSLGLAARLPDPEDDRSVVVALTSDGRAIGERLVATNTAIILSITADWTSDDREALRRLLGQIVAGYDSALEARLRTSGSQTDP